jgi:CheY-like chemotaxis protein
MVNRRVATSLLSQYGATVTAVNGGAEAISAVRNQEAGKEFDLILMDIQMPEVTSMKNFFCPFLSMWWCLTNASPRFQI